MLAGLLTLNSLRLLPVDALHFTLYAFYRCPNSYEKLGPRNLDIQVAHRTIQVSRMGNMADDRDDDLAVATNA